MAIQNFLSTYAYVWVFLILFIAVYVGLIKAKIPGNKSVLALASLLISFLVISSTETTNYLINLIPFLTLISTIILFLIIILVFVTKDFEPFKKPVAWTGFILAILICLAPAFNHFPALDNILPNSSNSELSDGLIQVKDFIYSQTFKDSFIFIASTIVVCFFLLKK
jgi:hypothetical protein